MEFNKTFKEIMDKSKNEETVDEGLMNRLAAGTALGLSLATGTPDAEASQKPATSIKAPDVIPPSTSINMGLLLKALITVESRGNDKAVGDNGKAFGPLQIHQEVVDDYNRWTGSKLKHEDMFDRNTAMKVCVKYLAMYGKIYQKKTGKAPSYEVLARIWNGGPNGYKNPNTDHYAAKVLKAL